MQEIALVLGTVLCLEQQEAAVELTNASIVSGGDLLRPHADRMLEKCFELDFRIAQHIGIGRAPCLIFLEEFGKDPLLVLFGEVDDLDIDADFVGHAHHVDQILSRRAILFIVVILPVLHEQADHVPALLLEQQGRHGRINTAREADHYGSLTHRHLDPSNPSNSPAAV